MSETPNTGERPRLLYADVTNQILGAFYATHTQLGTGFLEPVYANAVAVLLRNAGRRIEREVQFDVHFHNEVIGRYRADLVVESTVIVEVKASRVIERSHCAQLRNYLRVSGLRVGLLLNFGEEATFQRIIV